MSILDDAEAAMRNGDEPTAVELLQRAVTEDAGNLEAWLWLANLSPNGEAKRRYLMEVIALDPFNGEAKRALIQLRRGATPAFVSEPALVGPDASIEGPTGAAEAFALENSFEAVAMGDEAAAVPTTTIDTMRPSSEMVVATPSVPPQDAHTANPLTNDEALLSADTLDATTEEPIAGSEHVTEATETTAIPLAAPRLVWRRLFMNETDLREKFPPQVRELKETISTLSLSAPAAINRIDYAVQLLTKPRFDWPRMVSDVSAAAAEITEAMLRQHHYSDAFRIANTFGEATKIYFGIKRDVSERTLQRLVIIAVAAAAASAPHDSSVNVVQASLEKLLSASLGTAYDYRHEKFKSIRLDRAFADRLVTGTLASFFDRRLNELISSDRPRLSIFVSTNMPVVYRLPLEPQWLAKRDDWERAIASAGFDDLIRHLKGMGDLVRPDQIGEVSPDRRDEVRRAADVSDYARARQLFESAERELRQHLYSLGQDGLQLREPRMPEGELRRRPEWRKVLGLAKAGDPDSLKEAFSIAKVMWQGALESYELRDWVAYLAAQLKNSLMAEELLIQIGGGRDFKQNFVTNWNLAVLYAQRRGEDQKVYDVLLPLVDIDPADEDLIVALLAYSHRLGHYRKFLDLIAFARSFKFQPLAFTVAVDTKDLRAKQFLTNILNQWQSKWQLPDVTARYSTEQELSSVVGRAVVERQVDQVVTWLQTRLRTDKWVPNYRQLARVLEKERVDVDGAFDVLADAFHLVVKTARGADGPARKDAALRDLVELARRANRPDLLGKIAAVARQAGAPDNVLESYGLRERPDPDSGTVEHSAAGAESPEVMAVPESAALSKDLSWLIAALTRINNVEKFSREQPALEEFYGVVTDRFPTETTHLSEWLRSVANLINEFVQLPSERYAERQVVYGRVAGYERDIRSLLTSSAVSKRLADFMTPYHEALKRVVGDLSRQAGVGPQLKTRVLNTFVAHGSRRTTLLFLLQNSTGKDGGSSGQPLSNVHVELRIEGGVAAIVGRREEVIAQLPAGGLVELAFPITMESVLDEGQDLVVDLSIQASAEGFPNFDAGIAKFRIPVRRFLDAVGAEAIPKLFTPGKALAPDEPELFLGRDDVLDRIKNSFFNGVQRERLFLDGIRRVGKTSVINFVPSRMPDDVVAVTFNLESIATSGKVDSDREIRLIGERVNERFRELGFELPPLDDAASIRETVRYIAGVKKLTGRTPMLVLDEFQHLLEAIAQNAALTVVLDLLRVELEAGTVYALFTGSVRFDRLSQIVSHRIFGNLTRCRVSFLSPENTSAVLRAGVRNWAEVSERAVRAAYELTGGYPWLVQHLGSEMIELMNDERRAIIGEQDIERICREKLLPSNELFRHWWPPALLGRDEERFIELFLQQYPDVQSVPVAEVFSRADWRDVSGYKKAVDTLRACEIFDSTAVDVLRFSARLLRDWLKRQIRDGRLRVPVMDSAREQRGVVGIYVDHENLYKTLLGVATSKGLSPPETWFGRALTNIVNEVTRRVGRPDERVAVAFWDRPLETRLRAAYDTQEFLTRMPEKTKEKNAVDFKLVDEVRRSAERARKGGTFVEHVVLVTGDGDFSHMVRGLSNDGMNVHVWAGRDSTAELLKTIVGRDRVTRIEEVSGL